MDKLICKKCNRVCGNKASLSVHMSLAHDPLIKKRNSIGKIVKVDTNE